MIEPKDRKIVKWKFLVIGILIGWSATLLGQRIAEVKQPPRVVLIEKECDGQSNWIYDGDEYRCDGEKNDR